MDEAGDYALALSIALEVAVDSSLIASLLKDDRQVQKDRRIAKRLAVSPTKDTVLIAALLQVEEQAEKDHLLAVRLAGGPDVARETQGATATDDGRLDDETYNRLKRYNTQAGNYGKPDGKSDEKLDGSSTSRKRKMKECIVCRGDFPESDTTDAPCSHTLCRSCFITLLNTTMDDESLFPPKCCSRPIPITAKNPFITQSMVDKFKRKKIEFATVDRTYCSNRNCSTFIPPSSVQGKLGTCTSCRKQTCIRFKRTGHQGLCPVDEISQEVLNMGERQDWKRCVKCGHLIELTLGCNHMSESLFTVNET